MNTHITFQKNYGNKSKEAGFIQDKKPKSVKFVNNLIMNFLNLFIQVWNLRRGAKFIFVKDLGKECK